ncbi:MAG TPA: GNAT family N-acetyltransferase, partial [Actinomycetales bacterium]|nr:GNAT family N-acetyltransferase [Actinomycetales bacterium]
FTGRANSALAVGDPGLPLGDALDRVERWYATRELPPRVAVPWPLSVRRATTTGDERPGGPGIDTDLDHELARRGYRLQTPTLVLTASAREVRVATTPMAAEGAASGRASDLHLHLADEPDDAWLAVYHYRGQQLPSVARRLLMSAPSQVFASVRDSDGRAVAVARAASARGWTGVTAMEVDPSHRRRGLARRVLAEIAAWALERGDPSLYLQVAESNAAARALYESAGFAPHHGYHYRVRD